jgi:formate dehydrogenase subunit delta
MAQKSSDIDDLVRMANQIATFFEAYSEEEAVRETAYHLSHFWDPRMRRRLADHVRATGGQELSEVARAAALQVAPRETA